MQISPGDLVSLILQMKRPQHLDHWRAGQDHYWRGAYYRFYIEASQQDQLAALETGVDGRALVRYAAAAFLTLGELYAHQSNRVIAEHSAFVVPDELSGHVLWSYGGPGTHGYANPEGAQTGADTWETLLARASEIVRRESLAEHVRVLAEPVAEERPSDEWIGLLVEDDQSLQARRDALLAWAAFSQAVADIGAEWFVLDFTS